MSAIRLKLQDGLAEITFTATESELLLTSVTFTEQLEAAAVVVGVVVAAGVVLVVIGVVLMVVVGVRVVMATVPTVVAICVFMANVVVAGVSTGLVGGGAEVALPVVITPATGDVGGVVLPKESSG